MIELRWEEREIDTHWKGTPAKGVKAFLQYRTMQNVVKHDGGAYPQEWGEWQDVPTKQFVLMVG